MRTKLKVPARRLCVAVLSGLLVAGNAAAFNPAKEFGHVGITADGARLATYTTAASERLNFSWRAIEELRAAGAGVDGLVNGEFSDPAAHCDNEFLANCTRRIINLKNEAISALIGTGPRDPRRARIAIGRALHTVQDFYAHSNWVNSPGPSHASFNASLGRSVVTSLGGNQQTCVDDAEQSAFAGYGLTQVTTGYFSLDPNSLGAPRGKCAHGGLPFNVGPLGISKDEPGRAFFVPARSEAVAATQDFIMQVINAVKSDESAVRALMDIRSSIGFVIDDTGSMGRYINGVKSSVYTLGQDALADPGNAPDTFLLQTFNDPSIGPPQTYDNFASLLAGINAIHPNGGGDCPELAMTGVMSALGASKGSSSLFVYTDASSKDRYLSGAVGAYATSKKIILNYVVSGSCSPIDPAYYDTASRTGGALFLAYNTELATPFLRALSSPHTRLLFSAFETLAGDVRRYRINVDAAASKMTVAVGTDNIQGIKLIDPDGIDVTHDAAITALIDFYSGASLAVATPKVGEWTFEFTGTGKSFANAYVSSPISIVNLDPVEESGRFGHTGLFPINGSPVLGSAGLVQAVLEGASADQLEIRKLTGELVSVHAFTAAESEDLGQGIHKYQAPVTLDEIPVRFFLRGKDASGVTFLRAYPTSYSAQPIRVSVERADFKLEPGHSKAVNFVIENLGVDGDFDFLASASDKVIDPSFIPPTVHLASGASATVAVPITVPADSELEQVTILGTASDSANASRFNSHIVKFTVASRDSDSDGIVDDLDQCPASILDATVHVDACDSGVANHLFPEGCTIADEVGTLRAAATNHGGFVSATSHYTHDLVGLGVIQNKEASSIVSCAAKSTTP